MTNLQTTQNVLGISDAQIAPVTANSASSYTIGARIELPELKTLDITVKSITKDAIAGFTMLDSTTLKQSYQVKFESVNIPLDILALINGSPLTSSTDANTLTEKSSDVPAQFNLEFKTNYINGAASDLHMEMYCVKGLLDVATKADDYWTCSFDGTAYARKKDGAFRKITANKVAETIPAEDTAEYTVTP